MKGVEVKPTEFWYALGEKYLQYGPDEWDAICQRVVVNGKKDGQSGAWTYEFMDFGDPKNDITAIARTQRSRVALSPR